MNRCGFRNCKFNQACECTQKDGGGLPYGINTLGRLLHRKLSTEVKLYCRCCYPDIGQYNLVTRLINFAREWDIYEFKDQYESEEDFEKEIVKSLETKEGVLSLISFFKNTLEELDEDEENLIKEITDVIDILQLYEKNAG